MWSKLTLLKNVLHCLLISAWAVTGSADTSFVKIVFCFPTFARARLRATHSFQERFDPGGSDSIGSDWGSLFWLLSVSHFCQDFGQKELA